MVLLRTILILFIIFYIIRMFTRYILPSLFSNYMNSKMEEFSRMQSRQREQARKREGEVTIDYSPKNPRNKPTRGEYVDYTEVEE